MQGQQHQVEVVWVMFAYIVHCAHECSLGDQELSNTCISLQACNVQRSLFVLNRGQMRVNCRYELNSILYMQQQQQQASRLHGWNNTQQRQAAPCSKPSKPSKRLDPRTYPCLRLHICPPLYQQPNSSETSRPTRIL